MARKKLELQPFDPSEKKRRATRVAKHLGFRAHVDRLRPELEIRAERFEALRGTYWDVEVNRRVFEVALMLRYRRAELVFGAKKAVWRGLWDMRHAIEALDPEERDALAVIFTPNEHGELPLFEALDTGRWCPSHGFGRADACPICGVPQRVVIVTW